MRIIHVVGCSDFGGASHVVADLAAGAGAIGADVAVIASQPDFVKLLRSRGVDVFDEPVVRRRIGLRDVVDLARLRSIFDRYQPTLVHTHTTKGGVLGRSAARQRKATAVVHTVHGFAFHEGSNRVVRAGIVAVERKAASWCDRIVTVSEAHRRQAVEFGIAPPEKVIAIPNGLDMARVAVRRPPDEIRSIVGVGEDQVLIV